jgi:hypothetical protein
MDTGNPPPNSQKLDKLTNLAMPALRRAWVDIFACEAPPSAPRKYLIRAIAYYLQSESCQDLALDVVARLRALASKTDSNIEQLAIRASYLGLGAKLVREWKAETHEVVVVEGGYLYRGEIFGSLSKIARLITGTRWSGPLFFGLRKNSKKSSASRNFPYVVDLRNMNGLNTNRPKPAQNDS